MAKRKMKVGECKVIKNGMRLCMTKKGPRFKGKARKSRLSGTKRRRKRHCIRTGYTTHKGKRRKVCREYSK